MRDERYGWAVHLLKMCPFIIDGGPTERRARRPLAALHANPDRTAWVRFRHFHHAASAILLHHAEAVGHVSWDQIEAAALAAKAVMR